MLGRLGGPGDRDRLAEGEALQMAAEDALEQAPGELVLGLGAQDQDGRARPSAHRFRTGTRCGHCRRVADRDAMAEMLAQLAEIALGCGVSIRAWEAGMGGNS